MTHSVAELAKFLEAEYSGDGEHRVGAIADLKGAGITQLSFLSDSKFEPYLATTGAGVVVVALDCEVPASLNAIKVENPYIAYAKLSQLFVQRDVGTPGVHPTATIAPTACVDEGAIIGPHCVVEASASVGKGSELQANVFVGQGSVVGDGCLIYANVSIYHNVRIGNEVTIHSSTTIGSDGFGFAPSKDGWVKIHQLGGVIVGNNVEIGAGTAIDRGAVNDTVVGNGVIIDNQVHIAHNVQIGDFTAIAGCVGIAGSTTIGQRCTFGGGVAINGHITIVDNVHVNGGSVVTKSLTEAGQYASGTPLQEAKLWRKNAVRHGQLNEWVDRLKKIEKPTLANNNK